MSKSTREEVLELSADDLAILAAIIIVIGDIIGLFAVLKAKEEKIASNGSTNGTSNGAAGGGGSGDGGG